MRSAVLAAGLVLVATGLTGCSGSSPSSATVTETVIPTTTDIPTPDLTAIGLRVLRDQNPELIDQSDEDLLSLADTICTAFDSGMSGTDVFETSMGSGMSAGAIGAMMQFAVSVKCARNQAVLDEWYNS